MQVLFLNPPTPTPLWQRPTTKGFPADTGNADPGLLTLAKTPHISERVLASLEKEPSCRGGETTCSCQFLERSGGRGREGSRGGGRPWTWPSEAGASLTALITAKSSDEAALLFSDLKRLATWQPTGAAQGSSGGGGDSDFRVWWQRKATKMSLNRSGNRARRRFASSAFFSSGKPVGV